MNKQRGGTLLGFILGVVLGLGVALAVAVYVTKVPVPFVDRGSSRTVDQDAVEAQKNKDWDPNAPLYGKNPAKPAEAAASTDASATPGGAPAAPAVVAPVNPSVASPAPARPELKPAVSADPLGDLAKARANAGATDAYYYFVQVGAFRTPVDAESQRAKLSLAGIEAKVSEREQSGRTVYRVRVGPFEKKDDALKAKDRLDSAGMDTAMVSVAR